MFSDMRSAPNPSSSFSSPKTPSISKRRRFFGLDIRLGPTSQAIARNGEQRLMGYDPVVISKFSFEMILFLSGADPPFNDPCSRSEFRQNPDQAAGAVRAGDRRKGARVKVNTQNETHPNTSHSVVNPSKFSPNIS